MKDQKDMALMANTTNHTDCTSSHTQDVYRMPHSHTNRDQNFDYNKNRLTQTQAKRRSSLWKIPIKVVAGKENEIPLFWKRKDKRRELAEIRE